VKPPPAPKRHFCGSPCWLTHQGSVHQGRFLQKQREGRTERGWGGSCQWLGKLAALCKRLSLYESPQEAAIRSVKSGKSKQGCAGKPRRDSSACFVPKLNKMLYLCIMSCGLKACEILMLKKIRRENSNVHHQKCLFTAVPLWYLIKKQQPSLYYHRTNML